jgi:hypothetical protein
MVMVALALALTLLSAVLLFCYVICDISGISRSVGCSCSKERSKRVEAWNGSAPGHGVPSWSTYFVFCVQAARALGAPRPRPQLIPMNRSRNCVQRPYLPKYNLGNPTLGRSRFIYQMASIASTNWPMAPPITCTNKLVYSQPSTNQHATGQIKSGTTANLRCQIDSTTKSFEKLADSPQPMPLTSLVKS